MPRLSTYVVRQFAAQSLSLFAVAGFLVWITQTLRLFDVVTAKGQDMLTLLGQASLTTPPLAKAFIYITMGIGMARVLRGMQASRELHSIHSSRRIRALWGAVIIFAIGGAIAVSIVAHWLEPASRRAYNNWSEEIAADLVGRTLQPNRFQEVVPGLTVAIGGRRDDGTITDFFADDNREPAARKTYMADSAVVFFADEAYELSLRNGIAQYQRENGEFSEFGFSRYELSLSRLTAAGNGEITYDQRDTFDLLWEAQATGTLAPAAREKIEERIAEAFRVTSLCLFVAAIAAFPHARRGREKLPLEVIVLAVALGDRVLSGAAAQALPTGHNTGQLAILAVALSVLAWRFLGYRLRAPKAVIP